MAQKVMYPGMVNSPETTLTNGINETDTLIYVLDPARVPEPPNLMTLGTGTNAETVLVTAINDNALTVQRGFQGIAKSWPAGTVIARNFTEYDYGALKNNIEDLDASKETPAGAQAKAEAAAGAVRAELNAHKADYASMKFGSRPYTGDPFSDITYYIDAAAGNDENNGLSAVNAFKTWGKVLSVIPRFGGYGGITIRIIGNLNEIIRLENILAYGRAAHRISIVGDTGDADNHSVNGIELYSIVGGHHFSITVFCLTVNGPCKFYGCTGARIENCKPRNNGGPGVDSISSIITVSSCDFGTDIVQDCIFAQWSLVLSTNNTGNGTRNGLRAASAATIGKYGTQPTGTIANEITVTGSEIL